MSTRDEQTNQKRRNVPLEERGSSREPQRRAAGADGFSDNSLLYFNMLFNGLNPEERENPNYVREFAPDIMDRVTDSERRIQEDRDAQFRYYALIAGGPQSEDDVVTVGENGQRVSPSRGTSSFGSSSSEDASRYTGQRATGPFRALLDFIGEKESGGRYDTLVSHRRHGVTHNPNLTNMTINEVLEFQSGMIGRGHISTAVGKYQIIRGTMQGLVRSMGLTGNEQFTPEMQDRMATVLLEQRGLNSYLSGRIDADTFQNRIAREWASMPTTSGQSYYHGQNHNFAARDGYRIGGLIDGLVPA